MEDAALSTSKMDGTKKLEIFDIDQIKVVNESVKTAEDLVSNFYKMSASQWRGLKYDVKTLADLCNSEIVHGPFAQVLRYEAGNKDFPIGAALHDFYKICLQDHSILPKLEQSPDMKLFPFALYIISHELIHIVRFRKFLQSFEASPRERMAEETRVHEKTHEILNKVRVPGMGRVFKFYDKWHRRTHVFP